MKINLKHASFPICLFLFAGTGTLAAFAQSPPPAPSVTVTAGDPGDLDCGDTATASASASLSNPPTGQNEATLAQHWTWSISTGDSSTVYIDHPDASSTTYHCEHDDPGDYSIQVTASVTLHDPATGTDYGPYSGSDTFGDTAVDPPIASAAPTSAQVMHGNQLSPNGVTGSKHYPARLHFHVTSIGKVAHIAYTGPTWGFADDWRLGTILKSGALFKNGTLAESFPTNAYHVNPKWSNVWPNPPTPHSASHPNGYVEDTNREIVRIDTSPDTHWFTADQHFTNSGPNGASDNYHTVSADQPTSSRTVH